MTEPLSYTKICKNEENVTGTEQHLVYVVPDELPDECGGNSRLIHYHDLAVMNADGTYKSRTDIFYPIGESGILSMGSVGTKAASSSEETISKQLNFEDMERQINEF